MSSDGDATGNDSTTEAAMPDGDSGSDSGSDSDSDSDGGGAVFECEGQPDFRAFWERLDLEYAVFDYRLPDGDWAELGTSACAGLSDDPSDDELFDAIMNLARNLDDGHTTLWSGERYEDAQVNLYPYDDEVFDAEGVVEDNYLDGSLSFAADDYFAWGTIGDVGYLSLTSFDSLSPGGSEDGDIEAANAAMDMALADLAMTSAIIVDVRANWGGWDYVGLAVAQRFAGAQTVAWSERERNGPAHSDFTDWVDVLVEAAPASAYTGEVIVLTSGSTFSAGETFVLGMRVRDNVRLLGEPTSGHLSDLFYDELPNGWEFTYSGEQYRAADGEVYEAAGIPVDVEASFDAPALERGQDTMLEAALAEL